MMEFTILLVVATLLLAYRAVLTHPGHGNMQQIILVKRTINAIAGNIIMITYCVVLVAFDGDFQEIMTKDSREVLAVTYCLFLVFLTYVLTQVYLKYRPRSKTHGKQMLRH